jgi:hypothetical protein
MGRGINDLEKRLADLREEARPVRVVMVIITDGQENASREFRKEQIQKMIQEQEQQEQSDGPFVFWSADLAAIDDALAIGVHARSAMAFDQSSFGIAAVWGAASARIADYRAARSSDVSFTEEDRVQQDSEKQRK